ncbi:MAG: putative PEP-binding protein, partial [Oscillospiraceae bacterium]
LVRLETSPEDIEGMAVAQGILTARGGMTSHAAVVARGMGTCCVSGLGEMVVDYDKKQFTLGGKAYPEGSFISLDGSTGNVYGEAVPTVEASISGDFDRLMKWADDARVLEVYANADNRRDAQQGSDYGSEGIGLCRTEHMFFEADRIRAMREMIVATDAEARKKALAKILPYQQGDFEEIFEVMGERPVVIRFLDPPLHEFLPTDEGDIAEIAKELGLSVEKLHQVIDSLHEFNPMMGHRGVRLSVSYPEIAEMQTTAVIKAALATAKKTGKKIMPQIMIPLVGEVKEFRYVKEFVVQTADALIKEAGSDMTYEVGTMIEIPRAALTADEIAKEADFFSFGTNDLTQMTFGFSRDDAGKFLDYYYENKIYESDPFAHIDMKGVGQLVKLACELGRKANPSLHLGICGEHGGDPTSVEFCHDAGLDYVSCSPFRVPIARLAAAQAAIKNPR